MIKKVLLHIYKKVFVLLILVMLSAFFSDGVLAQEAITTEPPAQTQTSSETTVDPDSIGVDNSATLENSVDQTADTGNNAIASPSPTPEQTVLPDSTVNPTPTPSPEPSSAEATEGEPSASPDALPEPQPSPDTSIDNNADVTNNVSSTADSGNNSISQPEESGDSADSSAVSGQEATSSADLNNGEATPSAEISTGDAVSVVEAENSVNSTEVNSSVVNQTLNIFLSGDVDLTVVPYIIAEAVFAQDNQDLQVVNVMVFNGNNYAYLSNDIVSLANTGANSIKGGEQATINTGDAYSVVSLVNRVNTTIIDSTIHIVTINIFGKVDGNIILPEFEPDGSCCGEVNQIDNQATVQNNVTSSAVSGQNEIVTEDQGLIQTGNSKSAVNVVNFVNTNIIGMLFQYLFINNFGQWNGNFLGWEDFLAAAGGGSLHLLSVGGQGNGNGCCISDVSLKNQAAVYNNVSSTANTGGNSINGGNGTIRTGRAYSAVSLLNFINTNIIRSIGFFGFVNIFGTLNGDIGGESQFLTDETGSDEENLTDNNNQAQDQSQNQSEQTSDDSSDNSSAREQGGQLNVEFFHNVGEYVLPGDTITLSERTDF